LKSKEESLNGKLNLVLDALYEKGDLKFLGIKKPDEADSKDQGRPSRRLQWLHFT